MFYDYAMKIIQERLEQRDSIDAIIERIRKASMEGHIAFYPSGRCTRILLDAIQEQAPEILPKVLGCFDKSCEAVMGDMPVYDIVEFNSLTTDVSLLVVTANTFSERVLQEINQYTDYKGPALIVSKFMLSLPQNNHTVLSNISKIYDLLADQKSSMTYLIYWLSRLLDDESMTHLFGYDGKILSCKDDVTEYAGYKIFGLNDPECRKELSARIYYSEQVKAQKGDVIFDIGGFKGDTAVFFADSVGPSGKVYSFEPMPPNFTMLSKTVQKNNLSHIVIPVPKGCSDKSVGCKAVTSKSGGAWSFICDGDGIDDVLVTTVDDFVEENNIVRVDLIKMDIEGMEYRAISGARQTIQKFHPKLIIPLYHEAIDLLDLPLLINDLGSYEMILRCKIEGPFGINLFCSPKN